MRVVGYEIYRFFRWWKHVLEDIKKSLVGAIYVDSRYNKEVISKRICYNPLSLWRQRSIYNMKTLVKFSRKWIVVRHAGGRGRWCDIQLYLQIIEESSQTSWRRIWFQFLLCVVKLSRPYEFYDVYGVYLCSKFWLFILVWFALVFSV